MAIKQCDVLVIGGGLAGMTAAAFAAKEKLNVVLVEKSKELGGRARSQVVHEQIFNEGPHALYVGGRASETFAELKVKWIGKSPSLKGSGLAYAEDKLRMLPTDPASIWKTGLLDIRGKWELTKFFGSLYKMDRSGLGAYTLREWVYKNFHSESAREYLFALARLTTYTNAPEIMSVEPFILQLIIALSPMGGVFYLDNGWQTLVDGMSKLLESLQVNVMLQQSISKLTFNGTIYSGELNPDDSIEATHVIVATDPKTACTYIDDNVTIGKLGRAVPVRAACLDIGVTKLQIPERTFALGVSKPYYYSVHSAAAKLGPPDTCNVLVMKYLHPHEAEPDQSVKEELLNYMERIQPHWQQYLITYRFLPAMQVMHWVVGTTTGSYRGRPAVQPMQDRNIYFAGDWVGEEGLLSDASMASGKKAGCMAAASLAKMKQLTH